MNGTLQYGDLLIEWVADFDEDDGFTWTVQGIRHDGSGHYTLTDLAKTITTNHNDIDRAVRAEFDAACRDAADDALLTAAGF